MDFSSHSGFRGAGEGFPSIFDLSPKPYASKGSEKVIDRSTPRGIPPRPEHDPSSPLTDALTRARFVRTTCSNPNQLVGNATNKLGWQSLSIDRPCILWCVTPELKGVLLYHPERKPTNDAEALASSVHGTCYFSGPGDWWFKYQAGDGTNTGAGARIVDYIVHDAADPAVASKYLGEPGVHDCLQSHVSLAVHLTTYTLAAANVRRRSLVIQNLTPTIPVRIGVQNVLTGFATANDGNGLRLGGSAGNSITFSGDTLVRGNILGRTEFPGGLAELVVAEFY